MGQGKLLACSRHVALATGGISTHFLAVAAGWAVAGDCIVAAAPCTRSCRTHRRQQPMASSPTLMQRRRRIHSWRAVAGIHVNDESTVLVII
jgi:hypothetical protein